MFSVALVAPRLWWHDIYFTFRAMLFRKLPDTRRVDTEADQKKNMLNFEFHLFLLFSEKTGVRNTSSN